MALYSYVHICNWLFLRKKYTEWYDWQISPSSWNVYIGLYACSRKDVTTNQLNEVNRCALHI